MSSLLLRLVLLLQSANLLVQIVLKHSYRFDGILDDVSGESWIDASYLINIKVESGSPTDQAPDTLLQLGRVHVLLHRVLHLELEAIGVDLLGRVTATHVGM